MKKIIFCVVLSLCSAPFLFSFTGLDVDQRLVEFSNDFNKTLPSAATEQNVYSSAWIGKVFPSSPPHFAIGFEAGVTRLNLKPLKDMASLFGISGLPSLVVYPTITANARVGGFFLPFDIGFSAMYMNLTKLDSIAEGVGLRFFDIGGDFRWAILKGEGKMPQLSIGLGYYYIGGKISYSKDDLSAKIDYATHTAFLQAQVSKTFAFFTPFIGLRGIVSKSDTDWAWRATDARIAAASDYSGLSASGSGNVSSNWFDCVMPQVFGGFGLNFGYFALNFAAAYEFRYKNWGGDISIRFQM